MSKRLLIADDHPLFRAALKQIIGSSVDGAEIEEVPTYAELRERLNEHSYDAVFIDLDMPDSNGLSELVLIKKLLVDTPLVVVSAHETDTTITTCVEYGAHSYIVKSTPPTEIQTAVASILSGSPYFPSSYSAPSDDASSASTGGLDSLTPSQLKVLMHIGMGKLNKQIAYDLDITEATVKAHITSIFKKLGINNRTQAVLVAREHSAHLDAPS